MKPGDEMPETLEYRPVDRAGEYARAQRLLGLRIFLFGSGQLIVGLGGVLLHGTRIEGFGLLLFWLAILANFGLTLFFTVRYVYQYETHLRFGLYVMGVLIAFMSPGIIFFGQMCVGVILFGS